MAYDTVILATSGLKAYWRCDEASGNLVDEVAGKTAVPTGSPTYSATGALTGSGDSNTAVNLDASTDWFDTADHADFAFGNGAFTYECWAKRNTTGGVFPQMLSKGRQGNIHFGNATDKITIDCDTGQYVVRETGTTTDSAWHHIVYARATSGTGNSKLYKDGVDVTVEGTEIADVFATDVKGFAFGAAAGGGGGQELLGQLDEIAIYNVQLSPATVLAHYQAGTAVVGTGFQADAFQNGGFQDPQRNPELVVAGQAVHRAGVW